VASPPEAGRPPAPEPIEPRTATRQPRRWWVFEIWDEDRPLIILIFSDLFLFLTLLGTLVPVFLALRAMKWAGLQEAHLEVFEAMHHWAIFVGCVAFVINFYQKLIFQLFLTTEEEGANDA
jgi:hypothetical protein